MNTEFLGATNTELMDARVELRIAQNRLKSLVTHARDLQRQLNQFSDAKVADADEAGSDFVHGLYRGYHSGYKLAAKWVGELIEMDTL